MFINILIIEIPTYLHMHVNMEMINNIHQQEHPTDLHMPFDMEILKKINRHEGPRGLDRAATEQGGPCACPPG